MPLAIQTGVWEGFKPPQLIRLLPFMIAALPVLMALATWDPTETGNQLRLLLGILAVPALIVEVMVVAAALATGFRPLFMIAAWPLWSRVALLIVVMTAYAAALFNAPGREVALLHTSISALHFICGLAAFHLVQHKKMQLDRRYWSAVAAGVCAYGALVTIYIAAIPDVSHFDWQRFSLGVLNIRHVGYYCAFGGAAALGVFMVSQSRYSRFVAFALASVAFALMFWSGSRGAFVSVVGGTTITSLLIARLLSWRFGAATIGASSVGALLSLAHSVPHPAYGLIRMVNTREAESINALSSDRLHLWEGALKMFQKHPLIGFGQDQFRNVVPEALLTYNHPHNFVLQILLQWGAIGGVSFFALMAWGWSRACTVTRQSPSARLPAFLVLNTMLIFSLVDGTGYYAVPIVVTITALVACLAPLRMNERC